jgi:hypothetical protein
VSEAEAREWHRLVRAAVRECVTTWDLQTQAGPVTADALETIVNRAIVLLLRRFEGQPPETVVDLLPSLLRAMLTAFVEIMADERWGRPAMRTDWHAIGRAPRRTRPIVMIKIAEDPADAIVPFDVEIGIGEPGQEHPAMRVIAPGTYAVPRNIEAGELVSVRYPEGSPGSRVIAAIETWDEPEP